MESAGEALVLDVSGLGTGIGDVEGAIEKRRPIVVVARKPSEDADALQRSLAPLLTSRDGRSDWQAMRDAWRLRHFSACFGLAGRSGYRWRLVEADDRVSVAFEPDAAWQGADARTRP